MRLMILHFSHIGFTDGLTFILLTSIETSSLYLLLHVIQMCIRDSLCSGLSDHLRGVRGGLSAAAEAEAAGGSPGQGVAVGVGHGDHGVVKGRADMHGAQMCIRDSWRLCARPVKLPRQRVLWQAKW